MKTLSGIILAIALSAFSLSAQQLAMSPNEGQPPTNPTNAYVVGNDQISYDGGTTWTNLFATNLWIYTTQFVKTNPQSLFVTTKHLDGGAMGPKNKIFYMYWGTSSDMASITNIAYGCLLYLPSPEMTNSTVMFKPWCQYVPASTGP